jgi:hypothetical protein
MDIGNKPNKTGNHETHETHEKEMGKDRKMSDRKIGGKNELSSILLSDIFLSL